MMSNELNVTLYKTTNGTKTEVGIYRYFDVADATDARAALAEISEHVSRQMMSEREATK